MKVLIAANAAKKDALPCAGQIAQILEGQGLFARTLRLPVAQQADWDKALAGCDLVITVGGDGTLLHAAPYAARWGRPVLGVNLGRVGFLATMEKNDLAPLARLAQRDYQLDERLMLRASVPDLSYESDALNDVVISRGGGANTIRVQIYCDETLVHSYRGDGVVVATPTGSTAYSLSAGGPILDAQIGGIVVTPICAHSLNSPPMVFSAQRRLRIVTGEYAGGTAALSTDGRDSISLSEGLPVCLGLAPCSLSLISLYSADQFRAIDKKLKGR